MINFIKVWCCTSKSICCREGQFECSSHQKSPKNPSIDISLLWLTDERVIKMSILYKNTISVCQCWHVTEDSSFSQQCINPFCILFLNISFLFFSHPFPHFVPFICFFPYWFFSLSFWWDLVDWSWFSCPGITCHKCEVCY